MSQREIPTWDQYFIDLARHVATRSKDPSTQVGAVIVDPQHNVRALGYNGFPRGVADTADRLADRELKLMLTAHAETNAVYAAARMGVSTEGCTIYLSSLPPCADCSKAIIQAGIIRVGMPYGLADVPQRWRFSVDTGYLMLTEAGVRVSSIPMGTYNANSND